MNHIGGGAADRIETISGDHWITSSQDDLRLRRPLDGDVAVDVAILGGGFSGLWTAFHLLSGNPSLRVAIVERRFAAMARQGAMAAGAPPGSRSIPRR